MNNGIAVRVHNVRRLTAFAAVAGLVVAVLVMPAPAPSAAIDAQADRPDEARHGIDTARGRVWLLTREGVTVTGAGAQKTEVQLPDWQWVAPPYGCPPDLALGPGGEAVITSNVLSTLWRIDPDTLAVSVHPLELDADTDKDVGFSRLVWSSQHGAFFAISDHHGSLWRIDAGLTQAHKLPRSEPMPDPCLRPARSRIVPASAGRSPCAINAHPFLAARGC